MKTESTIISGRKLLSLSLFDVPMPAGGVTSFLDNTDSLWEALDHVGGIYKLHVVQVFTVRPERLHSTTIAVQRGSTVFLFRAKRPLLNLVWLVRLIRNAAIVMMNNESWSDLFSAVAARLCGVPVVMYYHNADKVAGGKLPAWALRLFRGRLIDAGATSSGALRELFRPSVRAPIYVVPFGVDAQTFAFGERQSGSVLRVLFCGRVSREKRIEEIISGISTAKSRAEISLTIVGQEQDSAHPYTTFLEQLARSLSVTVVMCGHAPHSTLRERFMEADLLVNMRPDEGFGKVFIEAMATGLPVIGRRIAPGPSSIIKDGSTGFLVDTDHELGILLDQLHANPALRNRIGRQAHESVMSSYTTQHALDAAATMFAALLGSVKKTDPGIHSGLMV